MLVPAKWAGFSKAASVLFELKENEMNASISNRQEVKR
jgi:hypothetical protein